MGGIYPCLVEHPFGNVGCDCNGWMDTPVISLRSAVIPRPVWHRPLVGLEEI